MSIIAALLLQIATANAGPSDYTIGAGDVLDITVHGHDFGRREYVVGASGEVSFPYVGKVDVSGLSPFGAEAALRDALADGYLVSPQVTLVVSEFKSQRIDVIGAVGKPGVYFLEGPTTVRGLVAKAGGAQLDKSSGQILIDRGEQTIRVALDELDGEAGQIELKAGDLVNIDEGSFVYLTGEVKKPGALTFSDGLTLSQAIIRAGGSSELGRLSGSYVLREGERISVNLKRILKGKDADILLQPGDQVVIPESPL